MYSLNPAFSKQTVTTEERDKLHSVSQRFTYQEPQYESENSQRSKKPAPKGKQQQKMTVRLRPRKVLCSNCQGICNENNENVDVSKKRKLESDDDTPHFSESSRTEKKYLMGSMLIPKLSRLQPSEISSAVKGTHKNSNKASEKQIKSEKSSNETATQEMAFVNVSEDMEGDKDDIKDDNDISFSSMFSSAKTLKICFGEGEGTVVKIPPLTGDFNEDSGVSCDMGKPVKPDSKAAKKALKKAKKQAKKSNSIEITQSSMHSPKHIGALSPHNNVTSPTIDPLEKKHKHKVKHKKKYKNQKKRDENTSKCAQIESVDYFSDIKEHCMKQKLSISLRRLSSNSYEKQSENDPIESGTEDWDNEMVPDFPLNCTEGVGGRLLRVSPGDVVWGKVAGFPWWPGRVLSVTPTSRAHVAWYASTTTSLMPCDSLSPFLDDYKVRKYCVFFECYE